MYEENWFEELLKKYCTRVITQIINIKYGLGGICYGFDLEFDFKPEGFKEVDAAVRDYIRPTFNIDIKLPNDKVIECSGCHVSEYRFSELV